MNLYASYIKEREGLEYLESPVGFVTYKFRSDGCYIQDIYVLPELRKSGKASSLADLVVLKAKDQGFTKLIGSVDCRANGSQDSQRVLLAYGMEPYTQEGSIIYYSKGI